MLEHLNEFDLETLHVLSDLSKENVRLHQRMGIANIPGFKLAAPMAVVYGLLQLFISLAFQIPGVPEYWKNFLDADPSIGVLLTLLQMFVLVMVAWPLIFLLARWLLVLYPNLSLARELDTVISVAITLREYQRGVAKDAGSSKE
jgi:hypothetical protein